MPKWVRQWGKTIQRLRKKQKSMKVEEVEIDELCTFVAQKKLVMGVDRRGRKVLDFVVGGRVERTGKRLYYRLRQYKARYLLPRPLASLPCGLADFTTSSF